MLWYDSYQYLVAFWSVMESVCNNSMVALLLRCCFQQRCYLKYDSKSSFLSLPNNVEIYFSIVLNLVVLFLFDRHRMETGSSWRIWNLRLMSLSGVDDNSVHRSLRHHWVVIRVVVGSVIALMNKRRLDPESELMKNC